MTKKWGGNMEIRKDNTDPQVINFTGKLAGLLQEAHQQQGNNDDSFIPKEILADQLLPITNPNGIFCPVIKDDCKGQRCMFWDVAGIKLSQDGNHSGGSCLFIGLNMSLRIVADQMYSKELSEGVITLQESGESNKECPY